MKIRWSLLLFSLLASTLTAAPVMPAPQNTVEPLDSIAVVVNDEVITTSQLNSAMEQAEMQMRKNNASPLPESTLKEQVLQHLIYESLQLQLAKKAGITASPEEVQKAIQHIAQQNNLSVSEFPARLEAEGIPYDNYKKQLQKQIIITKVQQEAVGPTIHISDADIKQAKKHFQTQQSASTEYNFSDILVPLPEAPSPEQLNSAKNKANDLIVNLRKNPFPTKTSDITIENNEWKKLAEVPDVYEPLLVKMKKGEIAGPVRTANGLHIIKLNGVRNNNSSGATDEQIQMWLYQQEFEKQVQIWLQKMYDSAYIRIQH